MTEKELTLRCLLWSQLNSIVLGMEHPSDDAKELDLRSLTPSCAQRHKFSRCSAGVGRQHENSKRIAKGAARHAQCQ